MSKYLNPYTDFGFKKLLSYSFHSVTHLTANGTLRQEKMRLKHPTTGYYPILLILNPVLQSLALHQLNP
jgi:hypothetical protein